MVHGFQARTTSGVFLYGVYMPSCTLVAADVCSPGILCAAQALALWQMQEAFATWAVRHTYMPHV